MVIWLYGYMVLRLYRYTVRLYSCTVIRLHFYSYKGTVVRLRLYGYTVIRLLFYGYTVTVLWL